MYNLRRFALILTILISAACGHCRRYTVLVSLDGFRWDYAQAYDAPFLDRLGQEGVKAVMRPSFPSVTFPNHYTLATGLVPDHHGIIANRFRDEASGLTFSLGDKTTKQDPRFWGGEPVWLTLQRQGVKTGVVYWPGSDVAIQGKYPTYYKDYERKPLLTYSERIAEVLRLLRLPEADRSQLVMAYFEEPDHTGHVTGPFSHETKRMVERMDALMEELVGGLRALPEADSINVIITADHGMTALSPERLVRPSDYLKAEWYDRIDYGLPTLIFPRKGCAEKILKALDGVPHIRAYRKDQVPEYLHYGSNVNIGDVVVIPDLGWTIGEQAPTLKGTHGFDPTSGDMHVLFRAAGPDFKTGYVKTETFPNVDVYPLLCHLMGVTPAANDGTLDEVTDLLKQQ